jgi:hypothetical protein
MEMWFQRGIAADPDDYDVYHRKFMYLRPRWYGTPEDLYKFGVECVRTGNWSSNIPMILVDAIDDLGEGNPGIYSKPEIWEPLEKVFREYLQRYPESMGCRSRFAKCAALGGHWKAAKEQFDLLGRNWSTSVFKQQEYAALLVKTKQNAP